MAEKGRERKSKETTKNGKNECRNETHKNPKKREKNTKRPMISASRKRTVSVYIL